MERLRQRGLKVEETLLTVPGYPGSEEVLNILRDGDDNRRVLVRGG